MSAYVTASGSFLPGEPVSNEDMEERLGRVHGKRSRAKSRILESNQIRTRYYSLRPDGTFSHHGYELAAEAIRAALAEAPISLEEIDLLSTATTVGDALVPGFGSFVHAELGIPECEVATAAGVCAASMQALQTAVSLVERGCRQNAIACGSELISRAFMASRFEVLEDLPKGSLPFETEFLRWMLSDGAGALLIQDRPASHGLSLRVEWIELRSHADLYGLCMLMGGEFDLSDGKLSRGFLEYPDQAQAAAKGAFNLQQDLRRLDDVVKVGVGHFFELVERGQVDLSNLDWVLCHYSSHFFQGRIHELLEQAGVRIPQERWFTNLYSCGNTGSASIFIMLDEFLRRGRAGTLEGGALQPGQKILCMVPESGGFMSSFMLLEVVEGTEGPTPEVSAVPEPRGLEWAQAEDAHMEELIRRLTRVWISFEGRLNRVPLIAKLNAGRLSADDYKRLLLNLRQQVVEGASWFARLISNLSPARIDMRNWFLDHTLYGHRDYLMLEHDYRAMGGSQAEIEGARKNVGSEALSAWLLQRASRPDPLDALGAMFVIEGLSSRLCPRWAQLVSRQLGIGPEAMTFLSHHAKHEDRQITGPLQELLGGILDGPLVDAIVRTAEVTARLYLLQLEEIE
jgi:3-oxoacyl-[acyl-carrier-protein] synthase-3